MKCAAVVCVVVLASVASAFPNPYRLPTLPPLPALKPVPRVFVEEPSHANFALAAAVAFIARLPDGDRGYFRCFWFGDEFPQEYLEEGVLLWRTLLQTVSTATPIIVPVSVPGTKDRLWAIDIRRANWSPDAFRSAIGFDQVFREPNVDHRLAETGRRLVGLQQDPKTFHAEIVVPAGRFMREIMETEGRTEAYYDLLYATERFGEYVKPSTLMKEPEKPKGKPWPGGKWPPTNPNGEYFPAGSFQTEIPEETAAYEKAMKAYKASKEVKVDAKRQANFPTNYDDWAKKWGADLVDKFLADQHLFLKNGEVVAGAKSDPKRGSFVSYQDRAIVLVYGPGGLLIMRTYDFAKTAGKGNIANTPLEVSKEQLDEAAGEHIVIKSDGFMASLLTGAANAGRKRVESGDARLVRSSLDPHDVVIRTQFSCINCHARDYGVIAPSNRKVAEALARGVNLLTYDAKDRESIESFFVGWEYKLETWRLPMRVGLQRVTATRDRPKGWTGPDWAAKIIQFRDWYDAPVDLQRAASELGVPPLAVMLVCLIEGSIDAGNLVMGDGVPRSVFDADLAPRLLLILAFARQVENGPDPLYDWFLPELLRQAEEKVKYKEQK